MGHQPPQLSLGRVIALRIFCGTIRHMPVSGGSADKLGNRYETLWALDQLLRVVDGTALCLTLEPLSIHESKGIEFTVANSDATTEFWSVKRQTTRAQGWTLPALVTKDEHGRTILGDLLAHVQRAPDHRAVFASTLGARDFEELEIARRATSCLADDSIDRPN